MKAQRVLLSIAAAIVDATLGSDAPRAQESGTTLSPQECRKLRRSMIRGWVEADVPHGSAVMLPDGQMFGRVLRANGGFEPIDCISVAGDDLHFWYADAGGVELPNFVASHSQAFDDGTIERLRRLSFAVVGASGTGSPTVEQLTRLGA
jgi:hypothetical protein